MANENVPAVPVAPLTPGKQTSEYAVTKMTGLINLVGLILGAILTVGPSLIGSANPNSKFAIIGGAIIGVATVINQTLTALGWTKNRHDLKVEQIKAHVASLSIQAQTAGSAPPQN